MKAKPSAADKSKDKETTSGRTSGVLAEYAAKMAEKTKNPKLFERKLSAEELADGIEAYFEQCEESRRKPTKPGLCNFLGISTSTWDNWARMAKESQNAEAKGIVTDLYKAYRWPIEKAKQRMGDELEQRTDAMAVFLLKQPFYGGYSDKCDGPGIGGNMSINITFGETHKNTARNYGR